MKKICLRDVRCLCTFSRPNRANVLKTLAVLNCVSAVADAVGGLFGSGGIYAGCIQDAVGNFCKKGLTFWSRDLFVALFMLLLTRRAAPKGVAAH